MSEQNVFTKKHSDALLQDQKAILEELNLPPAVVTFVRKNSTQIKIAIAVVILCILAWEGYDKYRSIQREKSSAMLYEAMSSDAVEAKTSMLVQLANEYRGTASGIWAKIELGHIALNDGRYQEAADHYSAAKEKLSSSNPLYPLVQFSLAQAYENLAETTHAREAYTTLVATAGFAGEGHLGLARIAEEEGNINEALSHYQEYIALPEVSDGPTKDRVTDKITRLSAMIAQ